MGLLVALIMYAIFVPKSSKRFVPSNDSVLASNPMMKLVTSLGNEIYAAMPAYFDKSEIKEVKNPKIEALLIKSGNPWNLTVEEFISFRYLAAIVGFVLSWPIWILLSTLITLPWYVVVPLITLFAGYVPTSKYNDAAKKRDADFRKQLPEALDLITISLSGGTTFPTALSNVQPTMEDGVLKEEFKNITNALDAGETLNEALEQFANRAPNDGVMTFIRSVQSATQVNAPLAEILESRAKATREEFFAIISQKAAQLESKMWLILAPTLMPAVILIAIAPSIGAIMEI